MPYPKKKTIRAQRGSMVILWVIIFSLLFIIIMDGMLNLFIYQNRLAQKTQAKEIAMQIAEAGINYYRWHLTQGKDDYADGTGDVCVYPNMCGPYIHDYYDSSVGEKIGEFKLYITPPPSGSTVVTIKSTGWLNGFANQSKTIEAKYGIPSLATYAFLSNSNTSFADNEKITGTIHSNGGIRMDGTNDSVVSSAQLTYTCDKIDGCDSDDETHPGVWRVTEPDSSLWQYPVPLVKFNNISLNLSQMKIDAQTSGAYYPASVAAGYRVVFQNNGTFDIYIVNDLQGTESQYNDDWTDKQDIAEEPNNQTLKAINATSVNGIIFIEDNVWVEGTVNGRFTLVSAKFTGAATIIINDNIAYANRDGSNILGLIAEKDIKIPKYAPDDLTIDAIMLAKNGRVFYNRYTSAQSKSSIEIYGGIITYKTGRLKWCVGIPCNNIKDGYELVTIIHDNDAAFSPPPYFPTTGRYTFISWKEKIAN